MTSLYETQNELSGNTYIELYIVDASGIGGSIYRFTPSVATPTGGSIVWQGNAYIPLPVSTEGWEVKGDGTQSKPKLQISNVNKTLLNAVISAGDLVGAYIKRYRTFTKFLDNGTNPDPNAHFPPDTYLIEQKLQHNNQMIVWQMTSVIDRIGIQIPRRQITKDGDSRYCQFPAVGLGRVQSY